MELRSSNPAVKVMERAAGQANFGGLELAASLQGTTTKSIALAAVTVVVGYLSMVGTFSGTLSSGTMMLGILLAFVTALVTCFKPEWSPVTAPAYAVFEGLGLGVLSAVMEVAYPGIVVTAVLSTFAVVMSMLFLWKFKVIVPTQKFRSVITGAIAGIMVLYIANLLFSLFGAQLLPSSGPIAILISLVVCVVAALSLILDFENIQIGVEQGLPKYFEYYNAFSLLVTICWLYVEILRLIAVLRESD
ncbi:MAG: Bax inhibitor-1/YccA family protein [Succinivibrionaceae bacterium]|nr:Bax inhibitor-1/YccA family protein [Succinivibrionaceae bacterium]